MIGQDCFAFGICCHKKGTDTTLTSDKVSFELFFSWIWPNWKYWAIYSRIKEQCIMCTHGDALLAFSWLEAYSGPTVQLKISGKKMRFGGIHNLCCEYINLSYVWWYTIRIYLFTGSLLKNKECICILFKHSIVCNNFFIYFI